MAGELSQKHHRLAAQLNFPAWNPKLQVNSSSDSVPFRPHPLFHHCFPHYCCPHHHWVCPPFICGHASPKCPNSLKLFAPDDTKRNETLAADKLPNGFPSHSNSLTLPASSIYNKYNTSQAGQSPAAQSPGFCLPFHFHGTPICPYRHFLPCRVHGCSQIPCLLSMRTSFPLLPLCSMPRPVPFFPSMPPSRPANYGGPDLKSVEIFSVNVVGEPTSSHMGTEGENWHENGEFQDSQNGAMEDAYEIEEEEDEPMFVLTDEWMEFFAKSEATRQQKKKQQQKEAKKVRKAERLASKKHENEAEIADSFVYGSEDGNIPAVS